MWEKCKGTIKCEKKTITYDVGTAQCEDETVKCKKKSKGTTKCEKRTVTYDIGTAQCEDGTVKCEKKIVTYNKRTIICNKNRTYAMLVLLNITIESSNLRKKIKEPLYVTKELSNVMLELHNVKMEPLNVRKK